MKTTPAQLKKKLTATIARLRESEKFFKEDTTGNPQILEMKHRTQGEINAFLAVLDSLNGSQCMINCYTQGVI